jgi:hypothetical protein
MRAWRVVRLRDIASTELNHGPHTALRRHPSGARGGPIMEGAALSGVDVAAAILRSMKKAG